MNFRYFLLPFYFASFLLQVVLSDLRFCHKGPHVIKETECPGGFIAFRPINLTCISYAKGSDVPDLTVRITGNLCDSSSSSLTLNPDGSGDDVSKLQTLHKVSFDLVDESADTTPGVEIEDSICSESCLPEWKNPFVIDDEPMFLDKPNVGDDQRKIYEHDYSKLTKEIFMVLMREENLHHDEPTNQSLGILGTNLESVGGMPNIIKLLAQSIRITFTKCSPFVETDFYTQVLKAMMYFHKRSSIHTLADISSHVFRKIFKLLKECEKTTNQFFKLNGTDCGSRHVVDSVIDLSNVEPVWKYHLQSRSFRWGIYDPIIEAAWIAVDFTHGHCFHTFHAASEVLRFHLYTSTMEALFQGSSVEKHWMYPVKLKNDDFWNTIMDTDDIKTQMRNLDACAAAGYIGSPYTERLLRPFVQEEQVDNPTLVEVDTGASFIGWKGSAAEYWRWYENQGGFKEISRNFGYCLDGSKENLEAVEEDMVERGILC